MANKTHIFRHDAMATYFEIRLVTEDASYAKQAAQAVWDVIDKTESELSRYLPTSEISLISNLTPGDVLKVSPRVFECLKLCLAYQTMTLGAFDPALGVYTQNRGQLLIDETSYHVAVEGGQVSLDLGAFGKGYSLDLAAEELKAWDIDQALLVSGGSSLLALGSPEAKGWKIGIGGSATNSYVYLKNNALGSSGTTVKGNHIINPLADENVDANKRTWAIAKTAAQADALSTAWMILDKEKIQSICQTQYNISGIIQDLTNPASLWATNPSPLS